MTHNVNTTTWTAVISDSGLLTALVGLMAACYGCGSPVPACTFTYYDWTPAACPMGSQTRSFTINNPGCYGSPPPSELSRTCTIPEYSLQFTVYNHTRGQIGSFSKTARAGAPVTLRIAEMGVTGVNPNRIFLRNAHQGDRIGEYVAYTPCLGWPAEACSQYGNASKTPGELTFQAPSTNTQYDVFLLNALDGTEYDCVEGGFVPNMSHWPVGYLHSFAGLRRAAAGEVLGGYTAIDGPEEGFRAAAAAFSDGLNPFGIKYGSLAFVGTGQADVAGAYVDSLPPGDVGMGGPNMFWILLNAAGRQALIDTPDYKWDLAVTTFHEVAHAHLGFVDPPGNTTCGLQSRHLNHMLWGPYPAEYVGNEYAYDRMLAVQGRLGAWGRDWAAYFALYQ